LGANFTHAVCVCVVWVVVLALVFDTTTIAKNAVRGIQRCSMSVSSRTKNQKKKRQ
jgi:hypothetical protein